MSKNLTTGLNFVLFLLGIALILVAQFVYLNQKISKVELTYLQANSAFIENELEQKIDEGIDNYIKREIEKQQMADNNIEPRDLSYEEMLVLMDDDAIKGSLDAKVIIVEFSEYQCPFCKMYYENAYQDILKNYVDKGLVKYVFRDYPLDFHQEAYPAALSAECVRDQLGDEGYFKMHDLLFENQEILSKDNYKKWASSLGANLSEFNKCFENDKFQEEIYKDLIDAQNLGIRGTPSFYINGRFLSGAQPFENFQAIIEQELKR